MPGLDEETILRMVSYQWGMILAHMAALIRTIGGTPFGMKEVQDKRAFARWFLEEWQGFSVTIPDGSDPNSVMMQAGLNTAQMKRSRIITADGTDEGAPVAIEVAGRPLWPALLAGEGYRLPDGRPGKAILTRYKPLAIEYGLPHVDEDGEVGP